MNPPLHSIIIGKEGPPLIILHGFLGMCDNWKTLGIAYSQMGLSVHLLDQRNHGRSFHSDQFSYEAMSLDVIKYLDSHNIDKAILIGHSMGGKTAMFTSVKYPDRVDKLIVVDIAPKYYPPHHQDVLEGMEKLSKSIIETRKNADILLQKYVKTPEIRMFLLKNLYRTDKGILDLRLNIEVLKANDFAIGEALPQGKKFDNDTLFLKGENSSYISNSDKDQIKINFPKSRLKIIENGSHWLHVEHPKTFLKVTKSFIFPK